MQVAEQPKTMTPCKGCGHAEAHGTSGCEFVVNVVFKGKYVSRIYRCGCRGCGK